LKQKVVKFLTRPGCHLCEEAFPLVERAARRARVEVEIVDIETDDALVAEYGLRIPVLLGPDGDVLAEGAVEAFEGLGKKIRKTGGRAWPRRPR
jgi:thiol-disulfide isomerase/thioredoxin